MIAMMTGLSYSYVNKILNARSPLNTDNAKRVIDSAHKVINMRRELLAS